VHLAARDAPHARTAAERLARAGLDLPLLLQGEGSKNELLERFRRLGNAILIGSQSFWEGVDVRGEALSLVVIDKLPFAPPDDPVLSARIEKLKSEGRNAFMEYQLPRAVINVKQGAGRLIRDETDRGVLMICDPRLITKPYGKRIWRSLPPMKRTRELAEAVAFFAAANARSPEAMNLSTLPGMLPISCRWTARRGRTAQSWLRLHLGRSPDRCKRRSKRAMDAVACRTAGDAPASVFGQHGFRQRGAHLARMARTIAVHRTGGRLPAYRERVLAYAPAVARIRPAAAGVFLGYDFHLGADGPQLIEINSNAGGALLNARLLRAQRACCAAVARMMPAPMPVEETFLAMFREEWRLARGNGHAAQRPLARIAIVDEAPAEQYLAPEFELFRQLFEASGIAALVADPLRADLRRRTPVAAAARSSTWSTTG
jgi:hypothetical protein